jgi:VWFA-related protein
MVARVVSLVSALALASVVLRAGAPQLPTFRAGVRTVAVYATVRDQEGHLVPDLPRDVFSVVDNGRPAAISVFSNEVQPITAAVMLDTSNSMVARVLRVRESTERFIDAIAPGDRVRLGTFGWEVAVSPLLTGDKARLKRVLHEELWPGGATPLWRALLSAMTSLEDQPGRRVVLALTDGNDADSAFSHPSAADVRRRAVRDSFMVYAIGMERIGDGPSGPLVTLDANLRLTPNPAAMYTGGLNREVLDVVEETGGGHFELATYADLDTTFARVVEELRHQYLIGFSPASLDGKTHNLELRVAVPGCTARARKSYVAGEER